MATRAESQPLPPAALKPRTSKRLLVWLAVGVIALAIGWQKTGVDIPQLVVGLPKMQHIVLGLLRPDLAVREVERSALELPIVIGAGEGGPVSAGPGLTISPSVIAPGQEFEVSGSDLAPGSQARLAIVEPGGPPAGRTIYTFEADESGTFRLRFDMPARFNPGPHLFRAEIAQPAVQWTIGPLTIHRWQPSETLLLALEKIVETIFLALVGTAFGVVFSIPLSFLAAQNLMRGTPGRVAVYYVTRTFFNLTRSIEVMIVAVIMTVVVGIGPFAGVMALVIHSIGALGKLYSEAIESIDDGPLEAITATGATRLQVILYAVVPQVVPAFISFTLYRWDINVRMSTIIGFVGGGGIGYLLIQYINLLQWSAAGTSIWLIAVVVGVMDYASAAIRKRVV